jgi:uncharacterized protein
LLEALFESVLIPAEVKRELTAFHATIPTFIETRDVSDHLAVESLLSLMDTGEAEAIVLAQETKADFIILDDLAGRLEAAARGLRVIGPMGILLRAKTERQISTVAEILSELDSALDVHVSAAVRAETLRLAGES